MNLTSPATARHRFNVKCFKNNALIYGFASSASGRHTFEVERGIDAVQYAIPGGQTWTWADGKWADGEFKPRAPKPAISPELYKAAEEYAAAFDERQKAVKKSFRKVTKPL